MRRWWNVALVAVGAEAARASSLRIVDHDGCPDSMLCGSWFTLADNGLHFLPLAVVVFAMLGFVASFAPAASPIPRARARRSERVVARIGGVAKALLAYVEDARRAAVWFAIVAAAVIGVATARYGSASAIHVGAAYLLLAALLFLSSRRAE
jgi:hypothetical protein